MKKLMILWSALLLCMSLEVLAQQPQWMIKNYTESTSKLIDYRTGVAINPNPMDFDIDDYDWIYNYKEGHNALYNHEGELEIFISNNTVFKPDGSEWYWMIKDGGTFWDGGDEYYLYDQEIVTVPVPGDCDRYYIFRYSYDDTNRSYLHYYIYDVEVHAFVDPETGAIVGDDDGVIVGKEIHSVFVPKHIVNYTRNITVSKMNSSGERFLIFESMVDGMFTTGPLVVHRAKITSTGVEYDGVAYATTYNTGNKVHETEIIKTSSGNYRYATCTYHKYSGVQTSRGIILTLDVNGTVIDQEMFTTNGYIKGMEFSPDGAYLYFTKTEAPYLQYVDAVAPTTVYNLTPTGYITAKSSYDISSIEVAHDGKMYYAGKNGISSLAEPNDPTSVWVNNDIAVQVKEFTRGYTYHITNRLIPLPAQVDGEQTYAPLSFPSSVSAGCDGSFEEICLEEYGGYQYYWYKSGVGFVVGIGPCFTPTSSGTYTVKVIDQNGCEREHSFHAFFSMPFIPTIDDVTLCDAMPMYLGWDTHPLAGYTCIYTIHWYYEGDHYPAYNNEYQIPYLGNGEYCAKVVLAGGITQTRCFDVNICGSPNPAFEATLDLVNNPFELVVENNPAYTDNYEFEMFVLYRDCDGDTTPGPWEYVETITRTSDFDTPVIFDVSTYPNCLYKIVHNVNNFCCPMSYTATEYVGWIFGLAAEDNPTIEQDVVKQSVSVYPNPTSGAFTIDVNVEGAQVTIVNLLGQKIYELDMEDSLTQQVDLSAQEAGVYIVHIEVGGQRTTQKLLLNSIETE